MSKGGGGQSGKVDYPDYIETIHGQALDNAGVDTPTSSVTDLVNTAVGNSPFSGETAYDPTTPLGEMTTELADFSTIVDGLDAEVSWPSFMNTAKGFADGNFTYDDEVDLNAELDAFSAQLREQLDMVTLPRFRGGMRDINAVMSSSFAIGESIIEASSQKEVNKFLADLRLKLNERKEQRNSTLVNSAAKMLEYELGKADVKKALTHYTAEINRLSIVANKEQIDTDLYIAVQDGKWDLDSIMYIGNMISAIAGAATVREGIDGPSTLRTAMGGALSGAGAGAMLTPGAPMIGGAIGGIGGLLMGLMG